MFQILIQCIYYSWNITPQSNRVFSPSCYHNWSHSIILLGWLLLLMCYLLRTVDPRIVCPALYFLHFLGLRKCCEWSAVAELGFLMGWGPTGIKGKEGKPISRADINSSENESLFPWGWKGSVIVSLPLGTWLVSSKGSVPASVVRRLSNQQQ